MSNNNKKIVLNAEKKLRKKVIKKYRKENRYDFIFLLILQCYVLTLFILSIATDSSFLSLILAIFSLITTFSAFYGAQRSPFCFRTAAFRSQRPPIF